MIKKNIKLLLMLVLATVLITLGSCKKDKKVTPEPSGEEPVEVTVSDIDKFIWYDMNLYYLWYKNVPDLADNRFATTQDLYTFLNTFNGDHDALFEALLYNRETIDKWSWIVDDYVALENSFQGVSLSMGFEYALFSNDGNKVFGVVQYVVPDSPADLAGMKRGDNFSAIDSQELNVNNYRTLLSGKDAFEISFADIVDYNPVLNGQKKSLVAIVVHENPIHFTKVIESEGRKIGYMVYNAFRSNYNNDLNTAFGEFKNAGIQDLILDFRYNGGGSVLTATYLSSMIYDNNPDKIFAITQYNDKLEAYFRDEYGSDYFNTRFESGVTQESGAVIPINTLNLSRVYIITTSGSASASELVINGLDPYIDVFTVGETTHGKYVGSFTIKDYDANGIINPNHTWALQPITLKIANSEGVSDFVNGFSPSFVAHEFDQVSVNEQYKWRTNLLPFGDPNEPMLKAALNAINGVPQTKSFKSSPFKKIADSKDLRPHAKEMFIEGDIFKRDYKQKK